MFYQIFMEYVLPALGTALGGLLTWGVTELVLFIKSKIKNQALANALTEIVEISDNAVRATYQTYVEGIKGTDLWTKEAQEKALKMSLDTIKSQLSQGATSWIAKNCNNIDDYLISIIESSINKNKN